MHSCVSFLPPVENAFVQQRKLDSVIFHSGRKLKMYTSKESNILDKHEIRTYIKDLINKNISTFSSSSRMICKKIIASEEYKKASEIYAYMALFDEVNLTDVIKQAIRDGKKVALPKIISKDEGIMEFYYLDSQKALTEQTSGGAYGILEPDETLPASPNPDSHTLILVPGRAFTKDGARLGRGKGYYDRFLAKEIVGSSPTMTRLPNVTVAGVCFGFQVLPELPTDPNDVKMDIILQG